MSVKTLRKENDDLKSKLKGMESELESLKASMKLAVPNKGEQEHGVQFVSDEYDDLTAGKKKIWDQIKRLSSKLDTISLQVNRISQAIDSFEMYSYQCNIKIVDIPQEAETESSEDTTSICLKLFSCIGADSTTQDIDIAHRVPAKSAQASRPNPIICKFVRRLAKEKVMSARRATNNVVAADLDLTPGSINHVGIYDHLIPRLQDLLQEAKRFKTANDYKYCWPKNSAIYLRQNDTSRVIKLNRISDFTALLQNNATTSAQAQSISSKVRDYSNFSPENFNNELTQINWDIITLDTHHDIDKMFSKFYSKFNRLVNKHAPLKTLSGRKAKRFSKPWITRGIRRSVKTKNKLFLSGDTEKYKLYRNHILTLTRLSKKLYFHEYFETNLSSIKKTWEGINSLLNRGRNRKSASKIEKPDNSGFTQDPSQIPNILNGHFASIGHKLASKPQSSHHSADYYHQTSFLNSFVSAPVTPYEVQLEILSIPNNKAHGLYSCPTRIYNPPVVSSLIFYQTYLILQLSLGHAKVIPIYKDGDETDPNNYRPISLLSSFNRIFERLVYVNA